MQELARAGVDPVHILVDHQVRLVLGQGYEWREQRVECLLLLSLRIELAWDVQIAAGNVQQFGKEDHVRDWRRSLCEQRLQLVELGRGRVVPLKPGGSFELHDCRVESTVLVVWRAEVTQSDVRLIEQPLFERNAQARLSNTRLARQQHDPPFTLLRLCPAPDQQLKLLLASDERGEGGGRMQSLEPAFDCAFASYAPRGYWRDEAFQLPLSDFPVLEDLARQLVRACGDYDAAWFRQGLQACRQVGRLTHDAALVGFAGTDEIAHNDEACGNADAHPQSPARRNRHQPRGRHNFQTRANRPLGVVLMCLRGAEVGQYPAAHILGDEPIEAPPPPLTLFVLVPHPLPHIFHFHPSRA